MVWAILQTKCAKCHTYVTNATRLSDALGRELPLCDAIGRELPLQAHVSDMSLNRHSYEQVSDMSLNKIGSATDRSGTRRA